ncbi:hypothetical protein KSI01_24890 [Kurthia sibirica]|uniref:Transcriptional regulator n=1 Tax=Kurthia sibirica TaxID=202750 RepID=A0A2U3ALP6_9BACL|nr:helix-turn-helix domain-containing protein [Kurthia sibirica]PWI25463.1 transcriptional regulator [Kurthia sibirica]GEK34956.1 hypothetical protein KSI01_24890 [Kurthia sibirica]
MKTKYDLPCNIAQTLNILGDRWTLLILHELLVGETNFNTIKEKLPGLSANLLSQRLKSLEDEQIVKSELYSSHPPRYAYTLTASGLALEDIFNSFILWGNHYVTPCYKELVSVEDDVAVEIGYYRKDNGQRVEAIHAKPISTKV